jgi:hypothetical protein
MPPEALFDRALTRRALLRAGLGAGMATAGAVLVPSMHGAAFAADRPSIQATSFASDLYASPDAQRFSLILLRPTSSEIRTDVAGPPVEVRFKAPGGDWGPYVKLRLDREGLPKRRGIYRTDAVFDAAGNWKVRAKIGGKVANTFPQKVAATAAAPVPGQAAPRAASPTVNDSLGVNPICTRDPQCPLHTVSLSDAIGSGTAVAVLFATPALCTSQYCGPVLDEMLKVMDPYRDRVTFVHVDIYKGTSATIVSPTVEAWNLPSEPWLFGIDGAGTVTARLDTAFGKTEMVSLFDGLVGA